MYMDESGKGFINQPDQKVFIFGGLVLDKKNVFDALNKFKPIFQHHKNTLHKKVNESIPFTKGTNEKSLRVDSMLDKFELHAIEIFNPERDNIRNGKLIKENPWRYYPDDLRLELINLVFSAVKPYIDKIFIFKIDRPGFTEFCKKIDEKPSDRLAYNFIIPFVLEEFDNWLKESENKGAIIPDKLDANIRENFVNELKEFSSDNLWSEPIIVESYSNAFTQLIDLITYCYYVVYTNAEHKANFKAINKAYKKHVKDLVDEKDLVQHLEIELEKIE